MPLLLSYPVVWRHVAISVVVIVKDSMTYTFIHGCMHAFDQHFFLRDLDSLSLSLSLSGASEYLTLITLVVF